MKHLTIRLITAAALLLVLLGIASPITVQAKGQCVTGHGSVVASTVKYPVHAGDVVVATITSTEPSDPVAAAIIEDGVTGGGSGGLGTATFTFTVPVAGRVYGYFEDFGGLVPPSFVWLLSINGGCPASNSATDGPIFSDGRLNNSDAAERAAVYCDKGGLDIYSIGDPWTMVLKVTRHEIDLVSKHPATNTLIKQNAAAGVALYRLTSGELQINAPGGEDGKGPYVYIFKDDCPRN